MECERKVVHLTNRWNAKHMQYIFRSLIAVMKRYLNTQRGTVDVVCKINDLMLSYFTLFSFAFGREKEGDLTQSYDKTPYTNRKFENQRTTHTNATKNFDYITIADRLRTVSWSNK